MTHLDFLPEELLPVVHAAEVLVLPQQLDGWLRAVRVQFGHVQVVDEHHHLLADRRASTYKHTLDQSLKDNKNHLFFLRIFPYPLTFIKIKHHFCLKNHIIYI